MVVDGRELGRRDRLAVPGAASHPREPGPASPPQHAQDEAARVERLESIFELASAGIGIVRSDGRMQMTNEVLRRSLGFSSEDFAAMPFVALSHPEDADRNLDLFAQLAAGEINHFAIKRLMRSDGRPMLAEVTVSAVTDAAGEVAYVIGTSRDVTESRRLKDDLRAAEQLYRLLVERTPAVVYVAEPGVAGAWLYVSPQIEEMLGFTVDEWLADPGIWLRQMHPDDLEGALAEEERSLMARDRETSSDVYRLRHRDGSTVWVRDDAILLYDGEGEATFHGVLVDVTDQKRLEERLEHQAFHDPLTGLPNRQLFHERVGQALERAPSRPEQVAVLFIDLDNFKTVNDTFGHARGDEVIVAAAHRLRACMPFGEMTARLGGDEFAILLDGVTAPQVTELAERVLAALNGRPLDCAGHNVTIGASIGIALAGPGETTETLLRNADLAMYQAKVHGRGRHALYEPGMHLAVASRFRLEEALQTAVAAGAITLVYQPIASLGTGAVVGAEALARWSDPELGSVPPSEFIAVAEQTGLIHELGRQLLEQACSDIVRWRARTGRDAYVTVNVSPLQLDDRRFPSSVLQILRKHSLSPSSLVLEVTEGLLVAERSRESLRELRTHGIRVAIDDFGTGYSSLAYLRHLPVDMVKIDQTFLHSDTGDARDASDTGDSEDRAFLQAIVGLAQTLRLATICEGIETERQLHDLLSTGCGFGQGYLLARPGPIADLPVTITALSAPAPDAALARSWPPRQRQGEI